MDSLVTEPLEKLKLLPRSELLGLPRISQSEVVAEGQKMAMTTYHDQLGDGRHLIAIQIIVPKWLGLFSTVFAKGFVVAPDDSRVDAEEALLWQFL